jgi:hypothetical protein
MYSIEGGGMIIDDNQVKKSMQENQSINQYQSITNTSHGFELEIDSFKSLAVGDEDNQVKKSMQENQSINQYQSINHPQTPATVLNWRLIHSNRWPLETRTTK